MSSLVRKFLFPDSKNLPTREYLKLTVLYFGVVVADDMLKPHPMERYFYQFQRHTAPFHMLIGVNIAIAKFLSSRSQIPARIGLKQSQQKFISSIPIFMFDNGFLYRFGGPRRPFCLGATKERLRGF